MATTYDLTEDRKSVWGKMKALNDKILSEKRAYSAEEQAEWDAMEKDLDRIDGQVKKQNQLAAIEKELGQVRNPTERRADPTDGQAKGGDDGFPDRRPLGVKLKSMADRGISRKDALAAIWSDQSPYKQRVMVAWNQFLTGSNVHEYAALQQDVDAQGGFLVAPEQFVARLIQDIDRTFAIRGLATIIPLIGAESIGVPTRDTDMSDTEWTTELGTGTHDTALSFGKRRLTPHPLAKKIKVSKDLMRAAALSPEAIVRERMTFKFGAVQETAFMSGTGSGQPLGVFTASNAGISTARDSSTGNTTTSITSDGLIECRNLMESQWQNNPNLRWIFHRHAVTQIMKLKTGDGAYIWQPGLTSDRPNQILGVPVIQSEYAPNTFTSQSYVGIIGDFSYYWIVDAMAVEIQRLLELYSESNQDGFHGRMKLDGAPILETAFARLKLA